MKFLSFLLVLISGSSASVNALENLSEPYASINPMPEYCFGYYVNSAPIEEIFREKDIKVVIEIGSWIGGGSTLHFAKMLKEKKGKLYAVDTWLGSSTQQQDKEHYQPILSQVYHQFLSNMMHWDLTDVVIPLRMSSQEAAQSLRIKPDLVYIDGEHTTEAVYQDLLMWYPFGGVLCGDDWCWSSVRQAVEIFAEEKGLQIDSVGNFWRLK